MDSTFACSLAKSQHLRKLKQQLTCRQECSSYSRLRRSTSNGPTNETRIPTFGSKEFTLDFCLRRLFSWSFLADVKEPILGTDFLQHSGVLVDIKKRRLIDKLTPLSRIPALTAILGTEDLKRLFSALCKLLKKFPILTNPALGCCQEGEWSNERDTLACHGRVKETCRYANLPLLPEFLQGVVAIVNQNV
ncbi:hypothetical protein TNCV_3007051 [Trichonephila clavipes]|nr:hypothetical protein TNCV_3007051 [Trichonephila clavipes]